MMIENTNDRELGTRFLPKFDKAGFVTGVVTDHATKDILMVAFLDQEAVAKTLETGLAHFHSRSRGELWCKGETSGNVLHVKRILVDCDQDALILECEPKGPTCHTGARSCFYRELVDHKLKRTTQ